MIGILHTDGGARGNPGPAGFAALLYDQNYLLVDMAAGYSAHATNNYAEYNGLIIGLKLAIKNGYRVLTCNLDSELAVKQLNGEYKIKNDDIKDFYLQIKQLMEDFESVTFVHIPREKNKQADKLVNLVLDIKGE